MQERGRETNTDTENVETWTQITKYVLKSREYSVYSVANICFRPFVLLERGGVTAEITRSYNLSEDLVVAHQQMQIDLFS
jgi:hypothetical protein